jgi:hypothetical protein
VTSGYRPALAAAAGFSVIGALAAMAVRRARRPADAQESHRSLAIDSDTIYRADVST